MTGTTVVSSRSGEDGVPKIPSCNDGITTCQRCGCDFAPIGHQLWCSAACRAVAWRQRHNCKGPAAPLPARGQRRAVTVYACDYCDTCALDEQLCRRVQPVHASGGRGRGLPLLRGAHRRGRTGRGGPWPMNLLLNLPQPDPKGQAEGSEPSAGEHYLTLGIRALLGDRALADWRGDEDHRWDDVPLSTDPLARERIPSGSSGGR